MSTDISSSILVMLVVHVCQTLRNIARGAYGDKFTKCLALGGKVCVGTITFLYYRSLETCFLAALKPEYTFRSTVSTYKKLEE